MGNEVNKSVEIADTQISGLPVKPTTGPYIYPNQINAESKSVMQHLDKMFIKKQPEKYTLEFG